VCVCVCVCVTSIFLNKIYSSGTHSDPKFRHGRLHPSEQQLFLHNSVIVIYYINSQSHCFVMLGMKLLQTVVCHQDQCNIKRWGDFIS
jgi:hypothetical protein